MKLRHETVVIITRILRKRFTGQITDTEALHVAYEIVEELDKPTEKVTYPKEVDDK
jgi:hypothetical protein